MAKKKKKKKAKLSQSQLDRRTAQQMVNAELAPTIAEINRQKAEAAANAKQRQDFINAMTQTASGMAQDYAPKVQSAFQTAAQDQTAFGKGYSDAFKSAQNEAASKTNTILQQSGAPQAQMAAGDTGAADALYGIAGAQPGSTLATEGAAFTSAAAKLPTTTALSGRQYGLAASNQDAAAMKDILAQLTQVQLKKPSLINDVIAQIQSNRAKEYQQSFENQLATQTLGLSTYKAQADVSYKQALLALKQQGLNISAAKAKREAGKAGLTTAQWLKLMQTSGELAEESHTAKTKRERQPDGSYKTVKVTKAKTYDEALAEQLNYGVPKNMAITSLNRKYKVGKERPFYKADLRSAGLKSLRQLAARMQAAVGTTSGAGRSYNFGAMGKAAIIKWIMTYQPDPGTY